MKRCGLFLSYRERTWAFSTSMCSRWWWIFLFRVMQSWLWLWLIQYISWGKWRGKSEQHPPQCTNYRHTTLSLLQRSLTQTTKQGNNTNHICAFVYILVSELNQHRLLTLQWDTGICLNATNSGILANRTGSGWRHKWTITKKWRESRSIVILLRHMRLIHHIFLAILLPNLFNSMYFHIIVGKEQVDLVIG